MQTVKLKTVNTMNGEYYIGFKTNKHNIFPNYTKKQIRRDDNMNQTNTMSSTLTQTLNKNLKQNTYNENLNIQTGDDTMKIDIDKIKQEVQTSTFKYIVGLKFVTNETPESVLRSIKEDIKITPICRFVVSDTTIVLQLDKSNMQPIAYYFLNKDTMERVLKELPTLNCSITSIRD